MDGDTFTEQRPVYDIGREVEEDQTRSADEIMANNPPFGSGGAAHDDGMLN